MSIISSSSRESSSSYGEDPCPSPLSIPPSHRRRPRSRRLRVWLRVWLRRSLSWALLGQLVLPVLLVLSRLLLLLLQRTDVSQIHL